MGKLETRSLSLSQSPHVKLQMGRSPQHRSDTLKLLEGKVESTHQFITQVRAFSVKTTAA